MIKKALCVMAAFAVLLPCLFFARADDEIQYQPPQTVSDAYIVMDANSGQIYVEKQSEKVKYPASITKILTVALAMEKVNADNADLDSDTITVSAEAIDLEEGASHIALCAGEVITLRDAFMATALPSANDAANCLAEYAGGTITGFVAMMNEKTGEIGCANTHFVNANGLYDDNHYTTARDMALIMKYAVSVPGVIEVLATNEYTMQPTNMNGEAREFGTGNAMQVTSLFQYDGTLCGKTGWTEESHHTLVTMAERDNRRLICVVMDSRQKYEKFKDSIALYDYCFNNFYEVCYPPEKLPSVEIPMCIGGEEVEKITAYAPRCSFALHKSVSVDDVSAEYINVPESLNYGEKAEMYIKFSLINENASMPYPLPQSGFVFKDEFQNIIPASDIDLTVPQDDKSLPGWSIPFICAGGAFLILFLIRQYNITVRRLRHKARRQRRLQRMREERIYNMPRVFDKATMPEQRIKEITRRQKPITYYVTQNYDEKRKKQQKHIYRR